MILYDPSGQRSLAIVFFDNEDDYARGDAALQAQGRPTGAAGGIEFRKYMAWHTDTFVAGPMTAAELLAAVRGE